MAKSKKEEPSEEVRVGRLGQVGAWWRKTIMDHPVVVAAGFVAIGWAGHAYWTSLFPPLPPAHVAPSPAAPTIPVRSDAGAPGSAAMNRGEPPWECEKHWFQVPATNFGTENGDEFTCGDQVFKIWVGPHVPGSLPGKRLVHFKARFAATGKGPAECAEQCELGKPSFAYSFEACAIARSPVFFDCEDPGFVRVRWRPTPL